MAQRPEAREIARGKWRGILEALGVSGAHLTGKNVPCPKCAGKDRFRFLDTDGAGTWICNKCGGGDGFHLLMLLRGTDFAATAADVLSVSGSQRIETRATATYTEEQRRKALNDLWKAGLPIDSGDEVDRYLRGRGITLTFRPDDLRFVPKCPVSNVPDVKTLPAMIALMRGPDGKGGTIHRTYLKDGMKAPIESPRRIMPGPIPKGSAVRLFPQQAKIGVAEGIETAIAAQRLTGIPVWAALNASMMEQFLPPAGVSEVVIFGDHDASFAGQAAAFELARRICDRVRVDIRIPGLSVDGAREGLDWNDVLMEAA